MSLTKKELDDTTALVQRGLAIAPREYTQHQAALQTEGRRLDLDTASLRAKEDIGKADQAIIELRSKTQNDTETELADVEQKIPQIAARIASSEAIIGHDSGANAAAQQSQAMCLITRRSAGSTKQIEANETALVEPGDTIKVLRADNAVSQTAVTNPRAADDVPPRGVKPPPTK